MICTLHQEGKRSLGRHRPRRNYKIFSQETWKKEPRGRFIGVAGRSKLKWNKYDTKLRAESFGTVRFQRLAVLSKEMKLTCQKMGEEFLHMCAELQLTVPRTYYVMLFHFSRNGHIFSPPSCLYLSHLFLFKSLPFSTSSIFPFLYFSQERHWNLLHFIPV